jgi:hypothetical protein
MEPEGANGSHAIRWPPAQGSRGSTMRFFAATGIYPINHAVVIKRALHEQGLTERKVEVEEMFAASTLEV